MAKNRLVVSQSYGSVLYSKILPDTPVLTRGQSYSIVKQCIVTACAVVDPWVMQENLCCEPAVFAACLDFCLLSPCSTAIPSLLVTLLGYLGLGRDASQDKRREKCSRQSGDKERGQGTEGG